MKQKHSPTHLPYPAIYHTQHHNIVTHEGEGEKNRSIFSLIMKMIDDDDDNIEDLSLLKQNFEIEIKRGGGEKQSKPK